MVMIKDEYGNDRFSLSKDVYNLTQVIKNKINNDDSQFLAIISGGVGSGKSLFAQWIGYAIDPTISADRICFSKKEFIDAVLKYKQKVIIADEGISIFFSRASMTKEGRLVSELMAQIRQKNLCILICVPEILTMDWTVIKATNMAVHVWESKKKINNRLVTIKGNAAIYPDIPGSLFKTKIVNYIRKKRNNPFAKVYRPNPWCTQPGTPKGEGFKEPWYPIGEEVYRQKKEDVLQKYREPDKKEPKINAQTQKKLEIQQLILNAKGKYPDLSDEMIAKVLGYSRERVGFLRREGEKGNPEPNI